MAFDTNKRNVGSSVFSAVHDEVIHREPMGEIVSQDMSREAEESTLLRDATEQQVKSGRLRRYIVCRSDLLSV
jgi:hypothetical protein